ncbi:MAG: redoxin family protein [Acidobacteria bacterium]|nr:redoxin family protein [Acidobacteriota bacterium]
MAQFELQKTNLTELGARLVYIAAEKRHGLWHPAKYLAENPISFPFLLDEDRSVTKAYGLYQGLAADAFRIAHPSTLVVAPSGQIEYIYVGAGQTDRIDTQALLGILRDRGAACSSKKHL